MPDAITLVGLSYVALSLVIGGLAATIVLWKPDLLARVNGGRPLRLPNTLYELLSFVLYMAVFWPLFFIVSIVDNRKAK